jgi:meso-butanediol dehydrogenase/(S,S)-butanediol dehydrogenase/diacetyl reductase
MGRVSGRSCIVTGAARGIGRAIGEALLDEGAHVCFADINGDQARSVAAENRDRADKTGAGVTWAEVDVTRRDQVRAMIDKTVAEFGRLDVKFNNAGVNKPMNFLDVSEDNWNFVMGVNGLGCLIGMQETARQMIAQGYRRQDHQHRVDRFSRQGYRQRRSLLRYRNSPWCRSPNRARAISPSTTSPSPALRRVWFATEMWEQVDQDLLEIGAAERPGQAMEDFAAGILKGRVAVPRDITGTTTFLASADSDYMTGQVVMIDGGMVLV